MSQIEEIKKILLRLIGVSKELHEVLIKEREFLIDHNIVGLNALSKEKDTICLWLNLLKEELNRLLNRFATEKDIQDIDLDKLTIVVEDTSIKMLRLQLISLSQGLKELNDFNRILIERSFDFYKDATDFLGSFGYFAEKDLTGTILSKEI
jgi:flagellar biosynthesis/type III secretory pathway chaperone